MDYRVLHGFRPSANQPSLLARELSKIGVPSESAIVGPNPFRYSCDIEVGDASQMSTVLADLAPRFDILHIHAITPFFTRGDMRFPMGTDLLALKAAGKRIVVHFRGSEVRLPSLFAERSPFNYVNENPSGVFTNMPEAFQQGYITLCRTLADAIVVGDPELQTYVPEARILPRAINLDKFPRTIARSHRPLIVHAPSSQSIKGTQYVLAAIEQLHGEGLQFDFKLVEGMPHADAMGLYRRSDIIIDQLRIGWYGVLAVEGMALGKAVVSYIRSDLESTFLGGTPVANANPFTVTDVLRRLITDEAYRLEVAERGYRYCKEHHDSNRVAFRASELYREVLLKPPNFDLAAYLAINRSQSIDLTARLKKGRPARWRVNSRIKNYVRGAMALIARKLHR